MSEPVKKKKCVCARCHVEDFCAANHWLLYDPYNKKCPNWRQGVKEHHKFMKECKKGWW